MRVEHDSRHSLARHETNRDAVIENEIPYPGGRRRGVARDFREACAPVHAGFGNRVVAELCDVDLVIAVAQPRGHGLAQVFAGRVVDKRELALVGIRRPQVILAFCQQNGLAAEVIEALDNARCNQGLGQLELRFGRPALRKPGDFFFRDTPRPVGIRTRQKNNLQRRERGEIERLHVETDAYSKLLLLDEALV